APAPAAIEEAVPCLVVSAPPQTPNTKHQTLITSHQTPIAKPQPAPRPAPAIPVCLLPSWLQPHVALFVIDSLETAALERFCDFLLNHITVRHRDWRALSWHGGDAQ